MITTKSKPNRKRNQSLLQSAVELVDQQIHKLVDSGTGVINASQVADLVYRKFVDPHSKLPELIQELAIESLREIARSRLEAILDPGAALERHADALDRETDELMAAGKLEPDDDFRRRNTVVGKRPTMAD